MIFSNITVLRYRGSAARGSEHRHTERAGSAPRPSPSPSSLACEFHGDGPSPSCVGAFRSLEPSQPDRRQERLIRTLLYEATVNVLSA
jgi:hypothetical protein